MDPHSSSPSPPSEHFWRRKAQLLCLRVNLAWWIKFFLPGFLVLTVLFSALVLSCRKNGLSLEPFLITYILSVGGNAFGAFLLSRKRFFSVKDAYAQLDVGCNLHTRLSSAIKGIGPWPSPDKNADSLLVWSKRKITVPIFLSLILIAASMKIPIKPLISQASTNYQEPLVWTKLDSMLQTLEEKHLAEESAIETLKQELESLRSQSPESWYDHSSLEASDSLKEKTENAAASLHNGLERLSDVLSRGENKGGKKEGAASFQDETLQTLQSELEKAIPNFSSGVLPLNKELLSRLKELLRDLNEAKQQGKTLSQEELEALKNKLKGDSEALSKEGGEKKGTGSKKGEDLGAGSINKGPGPAPLTLSDDVRQFIPNRIEILSHESNSDEEKGQLMGVTKTKPSVDKTKVGKLNAGGDSQAGDPGGGSILQNDLMPEERKLLERYFQ